LSNDIFALPNSQEYRSSTTLPKKKYYSITFPKLPLFQNYSLICQTDPIILHYQSELGYVYFVPPMVSEEDPHLDSFTAICLDPIHHVRSWPPGAHLSEITRWYNFVYPDCNCISNSRLRSTWSVQSLWDSC
jgi:hypothetical protein